MSKWSRENWLGNDRYLRYVKLYPGTDPESLTTAIREMQGRHCDLEEVKKAGIDLTYSLVPLMDMHSNSDEVKSMNSLFGLSGFCAHLYGCDELCAYRDFHVDQPNQRGGCS